MQVLFPAAFSHNPNQEQETVHVLYLIEEVQVDHQDIDKESVHKNMQIVIWSFEMLDKAVTRGKQQFKYLMDWPASICLADHYNASSSLHMCTKYYKCKRCTHILSQEMPSHRGLSHS